MAFPDIGAFSVRMTAHEKSSSEAMTSIERAAGDTFTALTNFSNFYYTGPVYFGTALTKMTLLYDTGSPELTMGITTCTVAKELYTIVLLAR